MLGAGHDKKYLRDRVLCVDERRHDAWDLGAGPVFALEGSVVVTGAAIQWLRDGLGVIGDASEISHLAQSAVTTGGVFFVPAFAGLGSPWWDPRARGTIIGITGGTGRAELALAVVEAMAFQTRDVVEAMTQAGGMPISEMRVDGGAAVMDLLLQIQADQLGVPVARPIITETTARGAAMLAGLAEGIWTDPQEISATWRLDQAFEPRDNRSESDAVHQDWLRAVARSRNWALRYRLANALLIFDKSETDIAFTPRAKPDAGRKRDICRLHKMSTEPD